MGIVFSIVAVEAYTIKPTSSATIAPRIIHSLGLVTRM